MDGQSVHPGDYVEGNKGIMLNIGDLLDGKYQVIKMLGKGAWGCVYLAENIKIGNNWAVKEIDLSRDSRINLLAEPEIMKKLNHPSLPRIVDIIREGDLLYIVEDYFEGVNLKELIRQRDFCTEEIVIEWAKQLCEILLYLHQQNPPIIYRDMKPGNIIIDNDNNVKLIDFGIAREYKYGQDSDSTFIGTRGYAAPEQFSTGRQSDERTDIYGLGATLYHVLTGISPNDPPYHMVPVREINPGLSKEIERIISKCVQNDPKLRYGSAAQVLEDLEEINLDTLGQGINIFQSFKGRVQTSTSRAVVVEKLVGTAVIAVGGANRGVGTTHLAVSIAHFLARHRFKVAVMELNENPALFTLEDEDSPAGKLSGSFKCSGIDFYKQNSNFAEVLRASYNYVILDLGQLIKFDDKGLIVKSPWFDEMDRADLPVVAAGAAIWQLKDLAPFIKEQGISNWQVVFKTPDLVLYKDLKEELKFRTYASAFSADPFKANEGQNEMLLELLQPVLPKEKKKSRLIFWK